MNVKNLMIEKMIKKRRTGWLLALGLALIGALAILAPVPLAFAPALQLTTLTGQTLTLSDWRGKPVIVTFWATDCAGCIKEIPPLRGLYQDYHARGLEMLAIAMYYDPPSHVVAMTGEQQLPYPVALDLTAASARAFGQVALTPTTFLIAPDGRIALQYTGLFDEQAIRAALDRFLKG
ncbi:TlpA family protein disulfide reductase [Methylovulum psychrotolerans]|uniref:TlpA family protein disulfide reductase n=2 Tax=Methylovulum psychrotolerans TaxID=1704499 RepID=A0A2S5CP14_9GAMM|nr:TlpA family protein disulfide reductase [Methylovulum psychrotolerans]